MSLFDRMTEGANMLHLGFKKKGGRGSDWSPSPSRSSSSSGRSCPKGQKMVFGKCKPVSGPASRFGDDVEKTGEPINEWMYSRPQVTSSRDLQYTLEDMAVACERSWADKMRFNKKKWEPLEELHKAEVEAIKTAANAAKACADASEKLDAY